MSTTPFFTAFHCSSDGTASGPTMLTFTLPSHCLLVSSTKRTNCLATIERTGRNEAALSFTSAACAASGTNAAAQAATSMRIFTLSSSSGFWPVESIGCPRRRQELEMREQRDKPAQQLLPVCREIAPAPVGETLAFA